RCSVSTSASACPRRRALPPLACWPRRRSVFMLNGSENGISNGVARNGPLIVKVGGAALDAPAEAAAIANTIAALHKAWLSGIVVVHGGGTEVDRHLSRLGLVSEKRDGIRITP